MSGGVGIQCSTRLTDAGDFCFFLQEGLRYVPVLTSSISSVVGFFAATELLQRDGNTFGPEFEQQYTGHKNYFYYVNRNKVVPGAECAHELFDELDRYTRQVVDFHHPGVPVRLERAFGAYYEGEREGFHLGVNEHRDGDANLVSTVVHATLPDGDCGFTGGGELTIAAESGLPTAPITHSNDTIGSVVYIGPKVFHDAKPIKLGGKRLVFCMFYAAEEGCDLRTSRSTWTRFARGPPEA